jgi:hypothetical protein
MRFFEIAAVREQLSGWFGSPISSTRALVDMLLFEPTAGRGMTTDAVTNNMHTHSVAMAFPLMILCIYWCHRILFDSEVRRRTTTVALTLALAWMTLSAVTYWATTMLLLALIVMIDLVQRRAWSRSVTVAIAMLGSLIVARFHGGVLTARSELTVGSDSFVLSKSFGMVPVFGGELEVWSWAFLREWVAPLLGATIFVLLIVKRRPAAWPVVGGIYLASTLVFLLPIVLTYQHAPAEIIRFFPFATFGFSVLVAAALWRLFLVRKARIPVAVFAFSLLLTTAIFQAQAIRYPLGSLGGGAAPAVEGWPSIQSIGLTAEDESDIDFMRTLPSSERLFSRTSIAPEMNQALSGRALLFATDFDIQERQLAAYDSLDSARWASIGANLIYVREGGDPGVEERLETVVSDGDSVTIERVRGRFPNRRFWLRVDDRDVAPCPMTIISCDELSR